MDSNAIEGLAVSKLKTVLILNDYLDPMINEGDKEPSWDGTVYLYKKKGKKKADIKGRVSIQVKGKEEKITQRNEIKYPVSVVDLKNYLTDNGIIYFVVYLDNQGNGKIYYCTMEPLRIKTFLEEVKRSDQKQKSISFRALPDDKNKVRDIFFNFHLNSQKQASFVNKEPFSFEEFAAKMSGKKLEMSIQTYGMKGLTDFEEFKKYNNPFMYAKVPELDILVPIEGLITEIIPYERTDISVGVSGQIYYEKVVRHINNDEVQLVLSQWLIITVNIRKKQFKIDIKSSPFFRAAEKDLSFFLEAIKNGNIEINGVSTKLLNGVSSIEGFDYDNNVKRLKDFKGIVKLLDILGIEDDIDMTKLTEEEMENLIMLKIALVDKKELTGFEESMDIFNVLTIDQYKFALIFLEVEGKPATYRIFDVFHEGLCIQVEDENGILHPIPFFAGLDSQYFAEITNIQFDKMLISFQELLFEENILDHANHVALSLIGAADIARKTDQQRKVKLLKTALSFIEWIKDADKEKHWMEKEILFLNRIQIQKRLGIVDRQDLRKVLTIAENPENDVSYRFAAYTLLENKTGAEMQFELLTDQQQKDLLDYPIGNLYKKLL